MAKKTPPMPMKGKMPPKEMPMHDMGEGKMPGKKHMMPMHEEMHGKAKKKK